MGESSATLKHTVNKRNGKPSKLEYRKGVRDTGQQVYLVPLDSGNLPALDLRVAKWQVATPSHARPSRIPGKVDTPKPRRIGFAHACPDEIKFGEPPSLVSGSPSSTENHAYTGTVRLDPSLPLCRQPTQKVESLSRHVRMDRPTPGLRLEAITPPRYDIMRIWRTLRPVDHAFIQGIIGDVVMFTETPGTELAPTIEEYTTLIQRPTPTTQGIFVPNPFATIRSQLSNLLGIPTLEIHQELHQGWDHGIRIAWLSNWTLLRALTPSTASYQRDACHRFLLLVFGTLLFPNSPNLIDGAIAQVVLQAIWLLMHVRPFCSSDPFSYIADERTLIERLGSTPPQLSQATPTPRATSTPAPEAESSTQAAMRAELRAIREERDRLCCELADSRAEVADYRELQTELARARARVAHLDREMARLTARLDRVRARAREISHP
ncbi:hypothetical protein CRG98_027315 [Punica granatum]|uniref:DUF7745 domain-containing protein n=1 Tax=Punica granatum TaxID=22663 RepID=A0A2I0J7R0_PUNGR|nr:hypothetical protein CRG98_027315 [Punica granatum]